MGRGLFHIAIIETSSIVYEGLANILLKSEHHYKLYRLEHFEEFMQSDLKDKVDLIILNPTMVQNNTRSFLQSKRANPRLLWIALVYSYFDKDIIDLFDMVLQINDSPETIANKIYRLAQSTEGGNEIRQSEQITERETDVLIQLVHGLSNKEIADKLNISIHTVVSHRKNIIQKTGIKSQAGLAIYAISNKIVSLDSFPDPEA